jgi:hypothetical protein
MSIAMKIGFPSAWLSCVVDALTGEAYCRCCLFVCLMPGGALCRHAWDLVAYDPIDHRPLVVVASWAIKAQSLAHRAACVCVLICAEAEGGALAWLGRRIDCLHIVRGAPSQA